MAKSTKTVRSASTGQIMTQPIGVKKSVKFAAVEGMTKSMAASALSERTTAKGLKGDAYRKEIAKAYKKA